MQAITRLKVKKLVDRLADSQGITLDLQDAVIEAIAARCTEVDTGARNIDHIIRGHLLPQISREVLSMLASEDSYDTLQVGVDADGSFTYTFVNAAEAVAT